jgi:rod shape-determining protein MreC
MLVLSAALLVLRDRPFMQSVRFAVGYLIDPVVYIADVPPQLLAWTRDHWTTRDSLQKSNEALRQEVLLLNRHVQKMAALITENERLRALLHSAERLSEKVVIAEIIGVDADPYRHEMILDQGKNVGIQEGQTVLDADGLIGQIIHVNARSSRALLITDPVHAVPIQINDKGIRGIAVGSGLLDKLYLTDVPNTADIQVGDLLISSDIGGRFPFGYPVGHVTLVNHDAGKPFARVEAQPLSKLDRIRHVLIVMREQPAVESTE